jgi:hypothetical protein
VRPTYAEHNRLAHQPVIEVCPRCFAGMLYRPQPNVVYCCHSGCTDSPEDKGLVYVSLDAVRAIMAAEGDGPRGVKLLEDMVQSVIPLLPRSQNGQAE